MWDSSTQHCSTYFYSFSLQHLLIFLFSPVLVITACEVLWYLLIRSLCIVRWLNIASTCLTCDWGLCDDQGQFPRGIDILSVCDYFAVGNRVSCYLELRWWLRLLCNSLRDQLYKSIIVQALYFIYISACLYFPFIALMLLVRWQEGHLASKTLHKHPIRFFFGKHSGSWPNLE